MKHKNSMAGLTLFEILLMIGLAAGFTLTGMFGISELNAIFQVRGTADQTRAQLQLGRELAIANKDQVSYTINLTSGIVTLKAGAVEIARYQSPPGVSFTPTSFSWGFTPVTGIMTGCALPCQVILTFGNNSEVINIQNNGVVN